MKPAWEGRTYTLRGLHIPMPNGSGVYKLFIIVATHLRITPVILDIESADLMVVIVMHQPLRHIVVFILDSKADDDVFVCVGG